MAKTKQESAVYRVAVVGFRELVNATIDRIAIDAVNDVAASDRKRAATR
jgi:hypothetical protein